MTREEAIKIIDCYDINFYDLSGEKIPAYKLAEAFDMAIEALTYKNLKKPNNTCEVDLISRADAIEAVRKCVVESELLADWNKAMESAQELLSALPSAEAEWIPCSERLPEVGEICLLTVREYGWNCKDYTRVIIGEYSDNYADHILAWMPLPKPYKGGAEE